MAYGVLGLSPEEFGRMTVHEFEAKVEGFNWLRLANARNTAQIIAAIGNYSGNLKKGHRIRVDDICPIKNPPRNIFFRRMFGLPY